MRFRFQIWSLVNRCGEFLIQNLELDTCVDVLTLGDRSDDSDYFFWAILTTINKPFFNGVVDLWHFGTDPDPVIRTSDLRIRILLFLSVAADKMPTKK